MARNGEKKDRLESKGFVVKGYRRPDGTYYTSVPKAIVAALNLRGGEIFSIRAKIGERKITARVIDIPEE
jgi:hypothetical protein